MRSDASNFGLTLDGFVTERSTCDYTCGDGVARRFEECDDGDNLGVYNSCNPDCTTGPRCGDGIRQPDLGEDCDAGPDNGSPGSGCSETCTVIVQ